MRSITVLLIFALAISFANANVIKSFGNADTKVPLFVRSLKNLQKGPPIHKANTRKALEIDWIEQKLDHFDESEKRTWQMRYMINDEHFEEGGPMFIKFGGEWEITERAISGGHLYDMAKEHKGILFYAEHRFYGESKPTSDITIDNLKYLHVKQALADFAHFIRHKKETVSALKNSKVIISGCSYSAAMVVWFKRMYPELVTGGWASSAPILAKVDFREFKEVVGRAMQELGSQKCYDRIKNGIAELESMFAQKRGAEVKAMMKLCNNFNENDDLDLWSLFGAISNVFTDIVQYQEEGQVPKDCDYLAQFEDDVTAIAGIMSRDDADSMLRDDDTDCLDATYKSSLDYYVNSTFTEDGTRPWYYQTCNEYGWYQSSGSSKQPFGTQIPLNLYTTMCYDIFGKKFTNEYINLQANQTNTEFGGMKPEVENIYMTHGGLDPWHPMGLSAKDGATIIPRASHCQDLGSIDASDSKEMRASKELLAQLVRKWLQD